MSDISTKHVIVTGGCNGIGEEIVNQFLEIGAFVHVVDVDREKGEKLVSLNEKLHFYEFDVAVPENITAFFKQLSSESVEPHILVNNAGISRFKELKVCDTSFWDDVVNTNLRAPFIFSREFAKMHKPVSYGRIINIASTRFVQSEPGSEAYGASKGGLVSLTHALAASLSGTGITVNCVSPGWINTNENASFSDVDHMQHFSGRIGKPCDVANIVLFLCEPQNDFINGEEIRVDGGMTRKMIYL
ncbi:SDR family NAD(P)-dependent oxidoreductase [Alkalitalea saponilacus]|nr:SDR family oxidoreductase [Alkalitalea saponilacus]ASB47983.1 oxidoreductase [Alkalitalea saponilacus]